MEKSIQYKYLKYKNKYIDLKKKKIKYEKKKLKIKETNQKGGSKNKNNLNLKNIKI